VALSFSAIQWGSMAQVWVSAHSHFWSQPLRIIAPQHATFSGFSQLSICCLEQAIFSSPGSSALETEIRSSKALLTTCRGELPWLSSDSCSISSLSESSPASSPHSFLHATTTPPQAASPIWPPVSPAASPAPLILSESSSCWYQRSLRPSPECPDFSGRTPSSTSPIKIHHSTYPLCPPGGQQPSSSGLATPSY